jgi:hypothetical protein
MARRYRLRNMVLSRARFSASHDRSHLVTWTKRRQLKLSECEHLIAERRRSTRIHDFGRPELGNRCARKCSSLSVTPPSARNQADDPDRRHTMASSQVRSRIRRYRQRSSFSSYAGGVMLPRHEQNHRARPRARVGSYWCLVVVSSNDQSRRTVRRRRTRARPRRTAWRAGARAGRRSAGYPAPPPKRGRSAGSPG